MNDLTIIIQGPLNVVSLAGIKNYSKFGRVIVSSWARGPAATERSAIDACREVDAKLLLSTPPDVSYLLNPQNACYQACSTLAGLQHTTTRFAIKFRSDEYYTELGGVLERLHRDPFRILSGSVYFRRDAQHKFHCGDHIIAGDRQILTRGFRRVLTTCETMLPITAGNLQPLPEQLITRGLLLAKGEQPLLANSRELMMRHFAPLSLQMFGKFSCRLHVHKKGQVSRDYIYEDDRNKINSTGKCIHDSIEEI